MPYGANRYNFGSPGAAATDALTQFLAEREAEKQRAMLQALALQDRARNQSRQDETDSRARLLFEQSQQDRADAIKAEGEAKRKAELIAEVQARIEGSDNLRRNNPAAYGPGAVAGGDPAGAEGSRNADRMLLRVLGVPEKDRPQETAGRDRAVAAYQAASTPEEKQAAAEHLVLQYGIKVTPPTREPDFTLAPGARRYGADGKLIAAAPDRPKDATTKNPDNPRLPAGVQEWIVGLPGETPDYQAAFAQVQKTMPQLLRAHPGLDTRLVVMLLKQAYQYREPTAQERLLESMGADAAFATGHTPTNSGAPATTAKPDSLGIR